MRCDIFDVVESEGREPMRYGRNDCLNFCANVIQEISGHDYIKPYRNTYNSKLGAAKLLRKLGGIEAAITSQCGKPTALLQLRRGDIALGDVGRDEEALGVVVGNKVAFKDGGKGVLYLPLTRCRLGWQLNG